MKNFLLAPVAIIFFVSVLMSGCRTNRVARVYQPAGKQLPPGQVKKIYGHQSAKAFAPRQQKKQATMFYPHVKVEGPGKGKPNKGGKKKSKKK